MPIKAFAKIATPRLSLAVRPIAANSYARQPDRLIKLSAVGAGHARDEGSVTMARSYEVALCVEPGTCVDTYDVKHYSNLHPHSFKHEK
jgi:hypothetical protein